MRARIRRPLQRGRVFAYRLRLGDRLVAPPGVYSRVPDRPPQVRGQTIAPFASFVVATETSWWLVAARTWATELSWVDREARRHPGPSHLFVFGQPFADPMAIPINAAVAALARDLAPSGNDLERRQAWFAASYLLGSSPALLEAYVGAPDGSLAAAVSAAARLMANVATQLLYEPASHDETRVDRDARRAVYTAFGGIAERTGRLRVGSRPTIVCIDPEGDPTADLALDDRAIGLIVSASPLVVRDPDKLPRDLAREIRRRDETIVLSLAPGTGYLAKPAPTHAHAQAATARELPGGRRYELAITGNESVGAPIAHDLIITSAPPESGASARRAGHIVTLAVASNTGALSHEIQLPPGRLRQLSGASPGLWIASRALADTPDLRADVLVRLVDSTTHAGLSRTIAEARPARDGKVRWDLSSVPDGTYEMRLDSAGGARRMPGGRPVRALQGQRFEVELERGEIVAIDREPVPSPASELVVDPVWLRVHNPVGAHGGSKWQGVFGREGEHSTTGNEVVPLVDGRAAFDAMKAAIRHATRSDHFVYVLGWWFDWLEDLLKLMRNAADRGVQVRMVLWRNLTAKKPLVGHIATVQVLDAMRDGAGIVDELTASGVGAHHQKLMLVSGDDGLTAFVGGIDWNLDRIKAPNPRRGQPLHDVHAQVRGPAAHDLLEVFVGRWHHHPEHAHVEDPSRRRPKRKLLALHQTIPINRPGTALVRVVETFNVVRSPRIVPENRFRRYACQYSRSQRDALFAAIDAADKYIYVEDQYLVSLEIACRLRDALSRDNKHVTILIPGNAVSDLAQVKKRRAAFLAKVREARNWEQRLGVYQRVDPPNKVREGSHTYVHAKTWLFDDEVAVIGSANANRRGLSSDSEVGVFFYDPAVVKSLRVHLWMEHLSCSASEAGSLTDAIWRKPPKASRVEPFDEKADGKSRTLEELIHGYTGSDAMMTSLLIGAAGSGISEWTWDTLIDPCVDDLPHCNELIASSSC